MGRSRLVLGLSVLLVAGSARAATPADVPGLLNFSGRLASDAGDFQGAADVTLSLYDDPVSMDPQHLLWTETQQVFVDAGRFHVLLGASPSNPIDPAVLEHTDRYALILDEFCQVCGYNRKYAIRLLNGPAPQKPTALRKTRSPSYSAKVISAKW